MFVAVPRDGRHNPSRRSRLLVGYRLGMIGVRHLAMETTARLVEVARPKQATGAVIVLHGGASRGDRMMVSPTQLSVIRMIPTARAAARAGRGRLAVYRLLNSWRGWDSEHTPGRGRAVGDG